MNDIDRRIIASMFAIIINFLAVIVSATSPKEEIYQSAIDDYASFIKGLKERNWGGINDEQQS